MQHYIIVKMKTLFANNIKDIRERLGKTQEEVAQMLGIERGTYSNYELGAREIPMPLMVRLAHVLGVELSDLAATDGPAKQDALLVAFRVDDLAPEDEKTIREFKDVVRSYMKMKRIASGNYSIE